MALDVLMLSNSITLDTSAKQGSITHRATAVNLLYGPHQATSNLPVPKQRSPNQQESQVINFPYWARTIWTEEDISVYKWQGSKVEATHNPSDSYFLPQTQNFKSLSQNKARHDPTMTCTPKLLVATYSTCRKLKDDTLLLWLQRCLCTELRFQLAGNWNQMVPRISRTAHSFVLLWRTLDELLKVEEICVRQKVQPYAHEELNNEYWHRGKRRSQLQGGNSCVSQCCQIHFSYSAEVLSLASNLEIGYSSHTKLTQPVFRVWNHIYSPSELNSYKPISLYSHLNLLSMHQPASPHGTNTGVFH